MNVLLATTLAVGGLNLAVVVGLAFRWGRWSGVVDTRLGHIETDIQTLKGEA